MGYQLINVKVEILDGRWSDIRSNDAVFRECAAKCVSELIKTAKPVLMEPFMNLTIEIP